MALQSAERTRLARAVVRQAVVAALLVVSGCLASNTRTGGHLGANRNTGRTISIVVAFGGAQFDAFKAGVEPYARSHHITIKWLVDSNFNADIVDRAKAGELPDIAMFPQPGILLQFARQGTIADLSKILDVADLRRQLVSGLLLPSTYNGDVYGIPPSINLKSVVFYPRKAWLRAGYPIPATLAQLMALTARIKADGRTPWCMGIEDTSATGWPATDWLEQLVLDLDGPDVYIRWVSHAVKFDSPPIRRAAQFFQTLFATPGFVHGGRKAIVSSNFATAGNSMFDDHLTESHPGCYMYKQGNFITGSGFFPDKIVKNLDQYVGVFAFPGLTETDKPVEGGGDVAALFSGRNKYAIEILKYMLTPTFCAACPQSFAYMSPFRNFALANYPDQVARQMAQIAYAATSFVFDASDEMPGAVGSGSFWREMTSWIGGETSLDSALRAIDASWPRD